MDRERSLHHKISKLQLQVKNFHDQISPVKESGRRKDGSKPNSSRDQDGSECHEVESINAFSILKPLMCILWPFLFPTLVYSIEGYCPLFWQITAISTFVTFFLMVAFSFLSFRMHKIVRRFYKMLYGAQSKVKIIVQEADCLQGKRIRQYTFAAILLLVISALGYWATQNNLPTLFNVSLIAGGFVGGVLAVDIYTFWKEPKHLPYVSPLRQKKRETANNSSSKRELKYPEMDLKRSPLLSPMDCFRTFPEEDSSQVEFLSTSSLPVCQEATPSLQKQSPAIFSFF